MIKWIKVKWNDPVWSKVFANTIWVILGTIITTFYFIYEYVKNNFSIKNTFTAIIEFITQPVSFEIWIVIVYSIALIIIGNLLSIQKHFSFKKDINEFTFCNQKEDDHYFPKILSLKEDNNYNIHIAPTKQSSYWRLGFCFNSSLNFTSTTRLKNLPMIHLLKNIGDNALYVAQYDKDNENTGNIPIQQSYINQEIRVSLVFDDASSSSIINIFAGTGELLYHQKYFGCYYVQIYAWGDSNDFEIKTDFQNFSRIGHY
jgi:hypothetical protein